MPTPRRTTMRKPLPRSRMAAAALATLLAACGGGSADTTGPNGNPGTNPGPTPAISLAIANTGGSVQPAGETSTTLTLTRSGGFTGTVSLTATGMPSGVSAIFGPPTLPGNVTSAVFTLGVDAGTAPGTYPITVTATGSGVAAASVTFQLTLTAPPDFALSVLPESLTVVQGEQSTALLQVQRLLGLSAPIAVMFDLGSTPLSGALSVSFARDTLFGSAPTDSVSFTVAVDFALVPGAYPIRLRGQSAGIDDRTATLVVVVEAPPSPGLLEVPDRIITTQGVPSAPATIVLQREPGVTGPATLSIDELPPTVTATFSPNPMPGDTATLVLTPSLQHPPGGIRLAVRAAIGTRSVVDTVQLSTQQFIPPDFGIAPSVPSVVVTAGSSELVTLAITRTGGYDGAVSVQLVGAPAGLTASASPSPTTGDLVLVTINAAATLRDASYPVVLEATGVGLSGTRTAALTVSVITPTSSTITWAFCDATRIPAWFAYRSGGIAGPWTRVQPTTPGSFTFSFPSSGQVAYVRTGANGSELEIFQYRPAEMFQQAALECAEHPARTVVSGSNANVGAGQAMSLAVGGADTLLANPANSFTLGGVASRTTDLLAVRGNFLGGTFNFLLRAILRRNVNPATASPFAPLDFGGAEWVQFAGSNVQFIDADGESFRNEMALHTTNGFVGTYFRDAFGADTTRELWGLPSSILAASDLHRATSVTSHPVSPRRVVRYRQDVSFFETTFGPRLAPPSITITNSTPVQARSFGSWTDDYGFDVSTTYRQGSGATARTVTYTAARATFGALSTSYNYTLPDFTGVDGWNPAWALQSGQPASFEHWVTGLENGVARAPLAGLNIRSGGFVGTLNP